MSNPISNVSKAVGLGAVLLAAYNASTIGTSNGMSEAKTRIGNQVGDVFVTQLSSSKQSFILEKLKNLYREYILTENMQSHLIKISSVIGSCGKEFAKNALPIGLGLGAMTIGIPGVPEICAFLLLLSGIKTLTVDVMGKGKQKI